MNRHLTSVFCVGALFLAAQAVQAAQITLYAGEGFRGRAFTTKRSVGDFRDDGFNDRASSVVVDNGNWVVCDDVGYRGRCVMLRPGAYDSLRRLGINDRISSVQRADQGQGRRRDMDRPEPVGRADYEYRRRPNEPVDEARVTSVRAVVRDRDRHCWVEREQVEERGPANVGGAVAGAIIGGIIGHQIGGGRGKDLATAGGVAAGAAIGANAGRDRGADAYDRDVRHCESRADGAPEYWDVTYDYRGVEHYVKMTAPPGRTILVNRNGEPRQ
ncbi:MAG: beta/gamma crystallin family protein [Gammaproteobacteria bacterium]